MWWWKSCLNYSTNTAVYCRNYRDDDDNNKTKKVITITTTTRSQCPHKKKFPSLKFFIATSSLGIVVLVTLYCCFIIFRSRSTRLIVAYRTSKHHCTIQSIFTWKAASTNGSAHWLDARQHHTFRFARWKCLYGRHRLQRTIQLESGHWDGKFIQKCSKARSSLSNFNSSRVFQSRARRFRMGWSI